MRQIISIVILAMICTNAYSQTDSNNPFKRFYSNHLKLKAEQKEAQIFAEVSPQFFAYGGYGAGIGYEFGHFQTGFIYIKTELKPVFRDAIFNNAEGVSVPENAV